MKGLVFDIQRFSISDGPGIRTTVFLKGCSLKCKWCHNPESISSRIQMQTFFHKCINCGTCFMICENHAHEVSDDLRVFHQERCRLCGECVSHCYSKSLIISGREMTVSEVMEEIKKDRTFYVDSRGGVTFSGGEPLLQSRYLKEILEECKKENIHTAVDTAGNVPFKAFLDVMDDTDLFLFDLKMMDREKHKEYTGASNDLILENLKKLAALRKRILIRIPVIPGVNDQKEEIRKMTDFIKALDIEAVELLPYHNLGGSKYESLSIPYELTELKTPSKEEMTVLGELFEKSGIKVKVS